MGSYRFKQVAQRLVTGPVLLAVVVTTFLPAWISTTYADTAPAADAETTTNVNSVSIPGGEASSASVSLPELVPLNTLILSEPGATDVLEATIADAGGRVYVRSENALFVGLDESLTYADLAPLGARAVYRETVSDSDLAALADNDRDVVTAWNAVIGSDPSDVTGHVEPIGEGDTRTFMVTPSSPSAAALALDEPGIYDTSTFLFGTVAVEVVFVESTGLATTENWTEQEISKVKTEVFNALNWWTVAATAPDTYGADPNSPRPDAQLNWVVNFYSPFEGTLEQQTALSIPDIEPINLTSTYAKGEMYQVAGRFLSKTPDQDIIYDWANQARDNANTDWSFVVFVVDSSAKGDGRFADGIVADGQLNGPFVMVASGAGDQGVNNLEAYIAKMVGHVFGAADESKGSGDSACDTEDTWGYLSVEHVNCDEDDDALPSLMVDRWMWQAYSQYQLSNSAREQIGWRDANENGIYDVVDTLSENDETNILTYYDSGAPVCPILHMTDVPVENTTTVPDFFNPELDDYWAVGKKSDDNDTLHYHPVNINTVGYVWGRINEGEWIGGSPSEGDTWEDMAADDLRYDIQLPGIAGETNAIEIVFMNRWDQEAYRGDNQPTPEDGLEIPPSPSTPATYESNASKVKLYDASGRPGGGMWITDSNAAYSGGSTQVSLLSAQEACFAFNGREVSILHSNVPVGTATVYIDGEEHSVIKYNGSEAITGPGQPKKHIIKNLMPGNHTVQLIHTSGNIDFDAFVIPGSGSQEVIDRNDSSVDFPASEFYEDTRFAPASGKLEYVGTWLPAPINNTDRFEIVGIGGDNSAYTSSYQYDRVYAHFKHADTVGVFRKVYPGGGSADVYLDGKLVGTMYNDAATEMVVPYYVSGLVASAEDVHTLEVRINPQPDGAPTPVFYFDAFRFMKLAERTGPDDIYAPVAPPYPSAPPTVMNVVHDGAQEAYGSWAPSRGNDAVFSRSPGDTLAVFFKGSAISLRRDFGGSSLVEVYVDGKLERTIDNQAGRGTDAPVLVHGLDPTRYHVLQIRIVLVNPRLIRGFLVTLRGYDVYYMRYHSAGEYEEYEYDYRPDERIDNPEETHFLYEEAWSFARRVTRGEEPSGQRYITSASADSAAYFYFDDSINAITVYGVTGRFGVAEIWVNGELLGSFNQSGRLGYNRPYTVTFLPTEHNVLEIRPARAANGRSTGSISLDRVLLYSKPILGPGTYENDSTSNIGGMNVPNLQLSGQWARTEDVRTRGGEPGPDGLAGTRDDICGAESCTHDAINNGTDELTFDVTNATAVEIFRKLDGRLGSADVYVNGQYHSTFNNYSAVRGGLYQQPYIIPGLDSRFTYTITIRPQLNARGRWGTYFIDYIKVRGNTDPIFHLTPDQYDDSAPGPITNRAITYLGPSWQHVNGPPPSSAPDPTTYSSATTAGDRVMVIFEGNAFSVFFTKIVRGGSFDVYVDGQLYGRASAGARSEIHDVPFSVAGLENGIHTAELIMAGGQVRLDYFEVYDFGAEEIGGSSETYTLVDRPENLIESGYWKPVNLNGTDYLQTDETNASLFIYVVGGDTLSITRYIQRSERDIEIYVNGEYHQTFKGDYLTRSDTLRYYHDPLETEETFVVSGLSNMLNKGTWIELRAVGRGGTATIRKLKAETLAPPLMSSSAPVEAEDLSDWIYQSGWWQVITPRGGGPSGGSYLMSRSSFSSFYFSVKNVSYATIYRPTGRFGDANVYIDGDLWGVMPNGGQAMNQVPYSIGPLPLDNEQHVIELRQAGRGNFGIDWIKPDAVQTYEAGYYEDTELYADGALIDPTAADPRRQTWKEVLNDNASGGTFRQTTVAGARLSMVFANDITKVTIYRQTAPRHGTMTVYIDGIPYPVSNSNGLRYGTFERVAHTIVLPPGLSIDGHHSMEIVTGRGAVNIDAIELGHALAADHGAYQEDDAMVVLNNTVHQWNRLETGEHSGGAHVVTNQIYSSIFFMFRGRRITSYMTQGGAWGRMSFYIDGEFVEDVDLHRVAPRGTPDDLFFAYDISGLPLKAHVLEIRYEGKVSRGGRGQVNFDVFSVDGAPIPIPGEQLKPAEPLDEGSGQDEDPLAVPRQGCYEENDKWTGAGTWRLGNTPGASGFIYDPENPELAGTVVYTNGGTDTTYREFRFAAESFSLLYHRGPDGGMAEIKLDGELLTDGIEIGGVPITAELYESGYPGTGIPIVDGALDMNAVEEYWLDDALVHVTGLDSNVVHVIRIRHPNDHANRIYIDRIDLPEYDAKYNDHCSDYK
ncbi:MAG: hypothetical protein JW966_13465 [Anaerolineae bacterium]|nr:hypothetical protein [Anaerolineae bacterium]